MSGRRQVRLSGELAERVEAVAESIRPRPAFSATAEMLVEDGLRAREAVAVLDRAVVKAQAEADSREDERAMYCDGQAAGLREALRLLKGGA